MHTLGFHDDPWPRLLWQAPLAVLLSLAGLMALVRLLEGPAAPPPGLLSVEVAVVEAPPTIPAHTAPRPARARPAPVAAPAPEPQAVTPERQPPPEPAPTPAPAVSQPAPETAAPDEGALAAPPALAGPSAPFLDSTRAPQGSEAARPPAPDRRRAALPGGPGGASRGGSRIGARAIYQPLPEIPEALRHRNIDVVALLRFVVAVSGAAHVELIEPTGDPELNRALLESLGRWRFVPAMQDGQPVASTVEIRIPISVR